MRPRLVPVAPSVTAVAEPLRAARELAWALVASTSHRIRRGEGALLAVNLSLIAVHGGAVGRMVAAALVSVLAILVMYAFNDLWDAPVDWNNPKKDRRLIGAWMAHRRVGVRVTLALKVVTLVLAAALLGPHAAAVAAVLIVNVTYSTWLKGVPIADVAAVAVWGMLYAAIVGAAPALLVVVGLMTAVCHVFQVLDDREPDAANGIRTTAVSSRTLSRDVLIACTVALVAIVLPYFGLVGALTAAVPLAIFFLVDEAGAGWLLTKAYFGVLWLALLGTAGAPG